MRRAANGRTPRRHACRGSAADERRRPGPAAPRPEDPAAAPRRRREGAAGPRLPRRPGRRHRRGGRGLARQLLPVLREQGRLLPGAGRGREHPHGRAPRRRSPPTATRTTLHDWLDDWFATYQSNGGVISTWQEMQASDPELVSFGQQVAASVVARLMEILEERGFGDPLVDALALLALIERTPYSVFTLRFTKRADAIDAMVTIVRRGFLGLAVVDFEFTDDQLELRDNARSVLSSACPPSVVRAHYESGGEALGLWQTLVGLDWPALGLPEEHGGMGLGLPRGGDPRRGARPGHRAHALPGHDHAVRGRHPGGGLVVHAGGGGERPVHGHARRRRGGSVATRGRRDDRDADRRGRVGDPGTQVPRARRRDAPRRSSSWRGDPARRATTASACSWCPAKTSRRTSS